MKGKRKIVKTRRRRLLTLCLALAMAFCYNMPVFAEEYVVNPEDSVNESGKRVPDKDLIGKIVWSGQDVFSALDEPYDYSEFGEGIEYKATWIVLYHNMLDESPLKGEKSKIGVPVLAEGSHKFVFPGEEGYNEVYEGEGTVRAWKIDIEDDPSYSLSGGTSYYINLLPVDTYKVTYHIGDNEYPGGYYAEAEGMTLIAGDELTVYGMEVPEKMTLAGWYDNPEFDGEAATEIPVSSTGAKDFYAKLEYEEYDIEYVLGDGGFLLGYEPPVSYTVQDEVTLPTAENLSKPMARFNGWYDNADFTGEAVTSIPAGSTGDKVFYANFETVIYEVEAPDSYILNSGEERTFHVLEASMDDLVSVEWDGAELTPENYTVSAGSTKVTFSPDFLDEQEVGEHLFKAIFKDGYGESQIKVLEPEEESVDPIDEPEEPSDEASEEVTEETSEEVSSEGDSTEKTAPDAEVSGGDDKSVSEDKTEASNVDSSVKTGDNAEPLLAAILMIAGLAGAVFVAFLGRRKRSSGK